MKKDIFCNISAGKSHATIIYRDNHIMAFLDIDPETPGHTLIIPRKHYKNLETIPPDIAAKMMILALKLGKQIRKKFHYDGIQIKAWSGDKLQDIPHLHFHILGKNRKPSKQLFYFKTFKNARDREKKLANSARVLRKDIEK